MFGNVELTVLDGIIVAAIVAVVEWPIKKWICKSNEKYKKIYTYAPVVLSAVVYLVIALVTKVPVGTNLFKGVSIGVAAMGSYDAIVNIVKNWSTTSYNEVGEAVKKAVEEKTK